MQESNKQESRLKEARRSRAPHNIASNDAAISGTLAQGQFEDSSVDNFGTIDPSKGEPLQLDAATLSSSNVTQNAIVRLRPEDSEQRINTRIEDDQGTIQTIALVHNQTNAIGDASHTQDDQVVQDSITEDNETPIQSQQKDKDDNEDYPSQIARRRSNQQAATRNAVTKKPATEVLQNDTMSQGTNSAQVRKTHLTIEQAESELLTEGLNVKK